MKAKLMALAGLICTVGVSPAASVISLDGTAYTAVSASSVLNPDYTPDNLFDQTPVVGAEMSLVGQDEGTAWAGVGTGPHYLAFQLDQIYDIASIFYAQRDYTNSHSASSDKVLTIDLWASTSQAFGASNPGIAPDASITLTDLVDDKFLENPLAPEVQGQYFLLRFASPAGEAFNSGGTELRLGGSVPEANAFFATSAALVAGLSRRRK